MSKSKKKVAVMDAAPLDDKKPTLNVAAPEELDDQKQKEVILNKHLDEITDELKQCKVRVTELQNFNKWLEDEALKTRIESHEYMNYMGKKTHKRQLAIITLSDHNRDMMKSIHEEKRKMEVEYEEKKKDLETILLGKKHVLEKTNQQMKALNECKVLREEQLAKVQFLEEQVMETRNQHAKTIQSLKENFLQDKEKFRLQAEDKIKTLQEDAKKEALSSLSTYTRNIQNENRVLRKQLMELMQKNHSLLIHQKKLEEQKNELMQEQQIAADLQKLRGKKLLHVLKMEDPGCGHEFPGLQTNSPTSLPKDND